MKMINDPSLIDFDKGEQNNNNPQILIVSTALET